MEYTICVGPYFKMEVRIKEKKDKVLLLLTSINRDGHKRGYPKIELTSVEDASAVAAFVATRTATELAKINQEAREKLIKEYREAQGSGISS